MSEILNDLKNIYKPDCLYYGTWNLADDIKNISLQDEKGHNLYEEFLKRYYYKPLLCIINDEEIVKTFKIGICSKVENNKRNLYFSKEVFLKNIIANLDEIIISAGQCPYQEIKKDLRLKKDAYRDAEKNQEDSSFYEEIKNEYLTCDLNISITEFITLCKKKYTKILSGYNAILSFFDKPLNIDKFISCFDTNQLYLYTCYQIMQSCENNNELSNHFDTIKTILDNYQTTVNDPRKENPFYNTHINFNDKIKHIYTIDDFLLEYSKLNENVNK